MTDPFEGRAAFRIKPLGVPGQPRPLELRDGRLTVGRAADNDLVLPEEDFPSVSQHHARFEERAGELWVVDTGSRNGVLVGGERVGEARLAAGAVVELGTLGPRLVVLGGGPLSETAYVDPATVGLARASEEGLSETRLRRVLGLPRGVGVEELVRRRGRRQLAGLVLVLLAAATVAVAWVARGRAGGWTSDGLAELGEALERALAAEAAAVQAADARAAHQHDLEQQLARLERDRVELSERLARIETGGEVSAEQLALMRGELDGTRGDIEAARDRLARLDPLDVEAGRVTEIARVRSAVVLLETDLSLHDGASGRALHVDQAGGRPLPNFDDRGEPVVLRSSGSGFCVSAEGWILTSGHVVATPSDSPLLALELAGARLVPRLSVRAIFSDTSERHEAEVVALEFDERQDVGLLRIEPFEGMPFLEDFDLEAPPPEPGSDVFLFGFPLGGFALQQGETVVASTFRGILSRVVDGMLQVDAGVHPGNSGGPVTDARGRVVGVVTSVQATPEMSAVYTIGYAIPIATARSVWPPPDR